MSTPACRIAPASDASPRLRLVGSKDRRTTNALIEQAQLAEKEGRFADARATYEQALVGLRYRGEGRIAGRLLRWIGITHQHEGDTEAAFDCFEAALAIAAAWDDEAETGLALNAQAVTYYKLGALEEAERLYIRARESARRSDQPKLAAMTSQNLGVIANIRGDLEQALWHYEASLAEYRALGLPNYVCTTLNNLGILYTRMERWETAEHASGGFRLRDIVDVYTRRVESMGCAPLADKYVALSRQRTAPCS